MQIHQFEDTHLRILPERKKKNPAINPSLTPCPVRCLSFSISYIVHSLLKIPLTLPAVSSTVSEILPMEDCIFHKNSLDFFFLNPCLPTRPAVICFQCSVKLIQRRLKESLSSIIRHALPFGTPCYSHERWTATHLIWYA